MATSGQRFCRQCGLRLEDTTDRPAHREHDAAGATSTAGAGVATASDRPAADGSATHGARARGDTTSGVATATATADPGRRCPACGASNSEARELCGRCGVDLETGVALPRAVPSPDRAGRTAPDEPLGETRRRGWLGPVLGVLAVILLLVVGLSLAGIGPFAAGPSLPEAEFDPATYDAEAEWLQLTDIATRTTRNEPGDDSDARMMADDEPDTAWRSDGTRSEDGVGEVIDLFLGEPAWIDRVVITNGFQRDSEAYAANARMKGADLVLDGGERIRINLLDLGLDRQAVELPEPRLTTTVRIEVLETFPGDSNPDLAVSDLYLEGWSAQDGDVELAEERAEELRAAAREG